MSKMIVRSFASVLLLVGMGSVAVGAPAAGLMEGYAQAAKAADPGFSGFSAPRGEALFRGKFGHSAETPSCTSCHTESPKQAGKTRAGKPIDPLAASVNPARFGEAEKVEKWFGRNCDSVLGRACTPLEKGDFITYMLGQ